MLVVIPGFLRAAGVSEALQEMLAKDGPFLLAVFNQKSEHDLVAEC